MGRRKRVIVWGAGGHGKVIIDALLAADACDVLGIVDDDPKKCGTAVLGIPVLNFSGGLSSLALRLDLDGVAVAIGNNYLRSQKLFDVRDKGFETVNVIHPSAHLSRFVELGKGVTVLAGATINAGTVVEDGVCVNTSASVDHDNHLGPYCHVFPNATLAGGVRVDEYAYVGSGAVVNPNVVVGRYAYVGAGAVVREDVQEGLIVAGVPAVEIGTQTMRPDRSLTQCLSHQ
jgi:acetyltransferase EpsM